MNVGWATVAAAFISSSLMGGFFQWLVSRKRNDADTELARVSASSTLAAGTMAILKPLTDRLAVVESEHRNQTYEYITNMAEHKAEMDDMRTELEELRKQTKACRHREAQHLKRIRKLEAAQEEI